MTLIQRLSTGTYTVQRHKTGYYYEGFYQDGGIETVQINGSLQPLTGRDLKMVQEEGERLTQAWQFFSDQPLVMINTQKGKLQGSDRVVINGETYKVTSQESWQGFNISLPYYRSILTREPNQ